MSSKLIPANPDDVMVIRDVTPNITTFSLPFLRFGRIKIGGRATVVKLSSGSLAVFSPVALTPSVRAKLTNLGDKVSYIAAPDIEHHIFLSEWHAAYPNAHILAPEGLKEKRAKQVGTDPKITDIPLSIIFTKAGKADVRVTEEFDHDFEYEFVDAHPNKELVFFYKPDKTLIEADLMFNLPAKEQYSKTGEDGASGFVTKLFGGLQNTAGEALGQRRLLWYGISSSDRQGFNASIKRINGWGFENIVPCHGDTILGDGKGIFEKVFKWHLEGKK